MTGEALIAALQASPLREIDIEPMRTPMPVRRPDRPLPAAAPSRQKRQ
ncbi:hypothetical protein JQ634_07400 [Bradyrhizobium sp. AUGA SZCCT0240]|nr:MULTISPECIES: hypothetical protein [unclassified Bradyrhizobium]MBR1194148.1 hypothetical protein [Bradyrhizobium sp. AUGA SZCCT0160]MBR1199196.1 hypothetical protein [Bradyrhizobium sp. AUGA SZCCT0158]MBR1249344.1 hypothetical protein [Bradyrhizobium sp. AUGA SZCCT0169]MBR1253522.1 hypothetical protein [Bradyrhizobium sp. AUGA SZCCT0240]